MVYHIKPLVLFHHMLLYMGYDLTLMYISCK